MISEAEMPCSGCFGLKIDQTELTSQKNSLLQSAYFKDALNSKLIELDEGHPNSPIIKREDQRLPSKQILQQPSLDLPIESPIEKENNEYVLEDQKQLNVSVVSLTDDIFEIATIPALTIPVSKPIFSPPSAKQQQQLQQLASENFDLEQSAEAVMNKPYVLKTLPSDKKQTELLNSIKNLEKYEWLYRGDSNPLGQITKNTIWIPFDLKEQIKIEMAFINHQEVCNLPPNYYINLKSNLLIKHGVSKQILSSMRPVIRTILYNKKIQRVRLDLMSWNIYDSLPNNSFFTETKMLGIYLLKLLIPDKLKRDSFRNAYLSSQKITNSAATKRGGPLSDFISFMYDLYTDIAIFLPVFVINDTQLIEKFQKKTLEKFGKVGLTIEGIIKLIVEGIRKEAELLDSGDPLRFSNNWMSAESIIYYLESNANPINFHQILLKITTKECFLMKRLNHLLIQHNTKSMDNLFPFYLFLQSALGLQRFTRETNNPGKDAINIYFLLDKSKPLTQYKQLQLFKKMNLSEKMAQQFINPKNHQKLFTFNSFFTATTLFKNTMLQNGNILFIINYIQANNKQKQDPLVIENSKKQQNSNLQQQQQQQSQLKITVISDAVYLEKISYQQGEHQVLFPSGCQFKIIKVKKEERQFVVLLESEVSK